VVVVVAVEGEAVEVLPRDACRRAATRKADRHYSSSSSSRWRYAGDVKVKGACGWDLASIALLQS
jgi:hypothetical protein